MYNNKRTFLLAFLLLGGGLLAVLYYNQRKTLVDTYYDIYALRELQPIKAMKAYEDFFKNEENKQWLIDDHTEFTKKMGFHWMGFEEALTLLQESSDLKTLYIAYMQHKRMPWGKEVSNLDQPLLQPYHQQHAQLRKQVRAELPALLEKDQQQQATDDEYRKMTLLGLAAEELANAVSIRVWELEAVAYAKLVKENPKEQERL